MPKYDHVTVIKRNIHDQLFQKETVGMNPALENNLIYINEWNTIYLHVNYLIITHSLASNIWVRSILKIGEAQLNKQKREGNRTKKKNAMMQIYSKLRNATAKGF